MHLNKPFQRYQPHLAAALLTVVLLPAACIESLAAESNELTFELKPEQGVMSKVVNYYRPMHITLTASPSEKLKAEPKYASAEPKYGAMQLGAGEDTQITVVLDETSPESSRIFIDRNNDEDLTNDGMNGSWQRTQGSSLGMSNLEIQVPYGHGSIPYQFNFYRFKTRYPDRVYFYRNSYRIGTVKLGGKTYLAALLDENADGLFDDLNSATILIDLDQDGKLEGRSDSAEYYRAGEPFNLHGQVYEVASASPDGTSLTLKPSQATVAMKRILEVGHPALDFTALMLDGKELNLRKEAAAHRFVLLDFWASWCGPCKPEFPRLKRLHARYKDHGLKIIGVTLDSDKSKAVQAAEKEGLDYAHVFDGKGWKNAVAQLYRVHSIPMTFLLDKDLNIVAKRLRGEAMERKVEELLGAGDTTDSANE